jgi:hypothetical protein
MARTRTIVGVVNFGARVVAVHTMLLVDWQGLAWQRQIDSLCGGFVGVRRGALMGQSHRGLPSRQWFVDWVDRREEVGFISSVCATGSSFHSVSITIIEAHRLQREGTGSIYMCVGHPRQAQTSST